MQDEGQDSVGDSGNEAAGEGGGRGGRHRRTSKYRGVTRALSERKWRAQVTHNGKTIYLGTFNTEAEAARAYDEKVVSLKGKRARTNFEISNYQAEVQWNEVHHPWREGTLIGYRTGDASSYWPGMMAASEDCSLYMLSLRHGDRNPLLVYIFGYHKFVWANQSELKQFAEVFPETPPVEIRTLYDLALQEAFEQAALLAQGVAYSATAPRQAALRLLANQALDLECRLSDCSRKCQQALNTADERLVAIWRDEVRNATSFKAICDRLMVLETDLRGVCVNPWWGQQRTRWMTRARNVTSLWSAEQVVTELVREGLNWSLIPRGDLPSLWPPPVPPSGSLPAPTPGTMSMFAPALQDDDDPDESAGDSDDDPDAGAAGSCPASPALHTAGLLASVAAASSAGVPAMVQHTRPSPSHRSRVSMHAQSPLPPHMSPIAASSPTRASTASGATPITPSNVAAAASSTPSAASASAASFHNRFSNPLVHGSLQGGASRASPLFSMSSFAALRHQAQSHYLSPSRQLSS